MAHLNKFIISLCIFALVYALGKTSFSQNKKQAEDIIEDTNFVWSQLTDGIEFSTYHLIGDTSVLRFEVYLLRIDPLKIKTEIVLAKDLERSASDIKSMANSRKALVGINANFFDLNSNPLGLIIRNGKKINKFHTGGKTLSGIFYIKDNEPKIVFRGTPIPDEVELAIQSGPRLMLDGNQIKLTPSEHSTRRSGIATTQDGKIIIYSTLLRFPGATLSQIQKMLLFPELNIKDALNLDGGSSSQFYINELIAPKGEEILLSGGDAVPVGLVFIKR
ncbi:MAG: phosphodiester glycosidase family protein [Deltaproteobacteria bacterium]|jgi:exopolysaccharide biosynthesis protein|nr:phosphodiester glycosidase family protein [Deltaproteobacteria bacterium]